MKKFVATCLAACVAATVMSVSVSAETTPSVTTSVNYSSQDDSAVSYAAPSNPETTVGLYSAPSAVADKTDINQNLQLKRGKSQTFSASLSNYPLDNNRLHLSVKDTTTTAGRPTFAIVITDKNGSVLAQSTATGSFSNAWGPLNDGPYDITIINNSPGTMNAEVNINTDRY